jgi:hypothetical protein
MSLQQLVNDFVKKSDSATPQQFAETASTLKTELIREIQSCFDKNQSIEDSKKLQDLVTQFSTFLSVYRESAGNN